MDKVAEIVYRIILLKAMLKPGVYVGTERSGVTYEILSSRDTHIMNRVWWQPQPLIRRIW